MGGEGGGVDHQPWILPEVPSDLSDQQRSALTTLLVEFQEIFSQADDNIGCTHLAEHAIHTKGPPCRIPYHQQNPHIRAEEETQVQQMLEQGIIRPS